MAGGELPVDPDVLSEAEFRLARHALVQRLTGTDKDSPARNWTEDKLRALTSQNPGHVVVRARAMGEDMRSLGDGIPFPD